MATTIIRVGAFDPHYEKIEEMIGLIAGDVETSFDFITEQRDFYIDAEDEFARIANALMGQGILTFTVEHP